MDKLEEYREKYALRPVGELETPEDVWTFARWLRDEFKDGPPPDEEVYLLQIRLKLKKLVDGGQAEFCGVLLSGLDKLRDAFARALKRERERKGGGGDNLRDS